MGRNSEKERRRKKQEIEKRKVILQNTACIPRLNTQVLVHPTQPALLKGVGAPFLAKIFRRCFH